MKNKKNGFTLIEMLVCIGIIAALGVIIGLSANTVIGKARKNDNKDLMTLIFDSAKVYVELTTSLCNINNVSTCNVTLKNLVDAGLLDQGYYNKENPVRDGDTFSETDVIVVKKSNGVKEATYKCSSNPTYDINTTNVDTYDYWGECN